MPSRDTLLALLVAVLLWSCLAAFMWFVFPRITL
jgi:hypothetical protein